MDVLSNINNLMIRLWLSRAVSTLVQMVITQLQGWSSQFSASVDMKSSTQEQVPQIKETVAKLAEAIQPSSVVAEIGWMSTILETSLFLEYLSRRLAGWTAGRTGVAGRKRWFLPAFDVLKLTWKQRWCSE
jgi:hypothetical protein